MWNISERLDFLVSKMSNKKYSYYNVPEPKDLKELVNYCADTYSDKTAFWYKIKNEEIKITFKKFKEDVEALGTYLYSIGVTNETHVALLGENSYEWIVSYFAVVNGGNIIVPIDKEQSYDDILKLFERSDSSLLIYSDTYSDITDNCGIKALNMSDFSEYTADGKKLIESGNLDFINHSVDNQKVCAIVYTSGTTSEPKGVMLSHRNLSLDAIVSSKNLSVPEGTVSVLPLYHTFGFMACVLCQMLKGYPVYINNSLKRVLSDIKYATPKHVCVVPMLLIAIYNQIWTNVQKQGKEKLFKTMIKVSNGLLKVGIDIRRIAFKQVFDAFGGNLEMLITGGSAIDEKYIKGFKDIGITVINGYGITECSPIVATTRNKHYAPKSVGAVHPETFVRIVDGEIQVKGETVFIGYYKNEEATKEAFDGEWFKTGDLGYVDEDGLLYITGRKKNLIILSNGKNVAPEELENLIMNNIPEVKETLVYGENDFITAEIFAEAENTDHIKSEIVRINADLPTYKNIANIKFRDCEFPKTSTKKIKRNYSEAKK